MSETHYNSLSSFWVVKIGTYEHVTIVQCLKYSRASCHNKIVCEVVLYGIPIFSYTAILKLLPYYIFVTYYTVSIPTVHILSRTVWYRVQINCTVCKLIVPCAKSRRYLPYEYSTRGKIWF